MERREDITMDTVSPGIALDCDGALRLVSASLDGEASLEEVDAVADHLVACEACRLAAEAMESDDLLLRRMAPQGDLPFVVASPRPGISQRRWVPLGLAAAAVLTLTVMGPWWNPGSGPSGSRLSEMPPTAHSNPSLPSAGSNEEDVRRQLAEAMQRVEALMSTPTSSLRIPSGNPFRDGRTRNPFARNASPQGADEGRHRQTVRPFDSETSTQPTILPRGWDRGQDSGRWRRPSTS